MLLLPGAALKGAKGVEAALAGNEGEAHEDVGGGQLVAAQVAAARRLELLVDELEVALDVGQQEGVEDAVCDDGGDGADEEGDVGALEACFERASVTHDYIQ